MSTKKIICYLTLPPNTPEISLPQGKAWFQTICFRTPRIKTNNDSTGLQISSSDNQLCEKKQEGKIINDSHNQISQNNELKRRALQEEQGSIYLRTCILKRVFF